MFAHPTVIIVGAGAGVEYNMPLGSTLASDIADAVRFRFGHSSNVPESGDRDLYNVLLRLYQNDKETLNWFTISGNELAAAISSSVSVDDALYQLSENAEAIKLGKMCIIRSIVKAERNSSIAYSQQNGRVDDGAGRDGWIEQLFSMAISGLKKSEIHTAFQNVTFVNFNYDRCIEHYLHVALQRIGVSEGDSSHIVSELKMIRPYGGIGSSLATSPDNAPFGANVDALRVIGRIRTYTESDALHDSKHLLKALHDAELTIFLGFGFHAQNLHLLQLPAARRKRVMATVKKVHEANRTDIVDALTQTLQTTERERVELYDMTAPELLRELRLKIMMRVGG